MFESRGVSITLCLFAVAQNRCLGLALCWVLDTAGLPPGAATKEEINNKIIVSFFEAYAFGQTKTLLV